MKRYQQRNNIDFWIAQALDEIKTLYGDECRVQDRSIRKFGTMGDGRSFGTTKATIAEFQGSEISETYATANTIDSLIGDSDDDIGKLMRVEGHTLDGSENMTFLSQPVTHGGTTRVPLTTSTFRATRLFVDGLGTIASPTTPVVGNTYIYDSSAAGGVTDGAPNTPAATKVMVAAGKTQSQKCATSISSSQYWILTASKLGIDKATGTNVSVFGDVEYRQIGGVFRPFGFNFDLSRDGLNFDVEDGKPYRIVPKNSDVEMKATSSAGSTLGYAWMLGVLAIIDS